MQRLQPSARQVRRAVALTLLGFVGLVVFGASAAPAAPAIPGFPDCKDAPVASWPGTGIPGALDPAPASLPRRGDPFATPPTSSVYEQYGYAGLTWHTYDLGCGGALRDVEASLDTSVGNFFLNLGVWGTAATNGLHNRVAHPQDYMGPLDSVVDVVTARLRDAVWTPWGGAALLGVVAILLVYALRSSLSSVTSSAVWAVLVLTVLAAVSQYPSRAAQFFDDAVTSSISSINAGASGLAPGSGSVDPARTQGAMLVDSVLYDAWLRGTFGDSHSVAAKRWGPTLFKASALTWREAAQSADPEQALAIADAKTQQWKDTAALIAEQDPATYAVLQGKAGGRFGTGLLAMLGAMFTGLFRLVADAFLFAGLVMLRLVIMFFPAVAVIGVMSPLASIVRRVANLSAASVVNVVAFAAGSAIHTAAVSAILSYARGTGMQILAIVLSLVLTVAAFVLLAPLLSFGTVLGQSSRRRRLLGSLGRYGLGYGIARHAVEHGTEGALQSGGGSEETTGPGSGTAPGAGEAAPRSESFGREAASEPVWAGSLGGGAEGDERPRLRGGPGGRSGPGWPSRPASPWAGPSSPWAGPSGRHTRSPWGESTRAEHDRPYEPRELLVGTVVHHPSDSATSPRPERAHDSQAEVTRTGFGFGVYDPATRQTTFVDPDDYPEERAS